MTNYADQAHQLWGRHLFISAKITDMSRVNESKAKRRVAKDLASRRIVASTDELVLVATELKKINEGDIIRSSLIEEDIFIRQQVDSLNLLALVHGHKPTGRHPHE